MSSPRPDFSQVGFVKTFVLPALLIFVVPVVALLFFRHAEAWFDADVREGILRDVRADTRRSPQERDQAVDFFTRTPFSQLVADPAVAASVDGDLAFYYATFRWMNRLAWWSILAGVGVFVFVGVCVLFSLRSQTAQYWSLQAGWHVLRLYGAAQTVVIGVLLVALSFWVTALWFNFYSVKLILVVGVFALIAAGLVIVAIFTTPKEEFAIDGVVLRRDDAPLWRELDALCARVGAEPPDQVVAGIDDNFFVTESPVTVRGETYHGKTLFVSLALLKQLNAAEAQAVLAHEMAHFSGQDTLYSRRIGPLLRRYGAYLHALHQGVITWPVYSFMLCFRALYELSLGRLSRQREFRADAVAAEATSPADVAAALVRVMAYSRFRATVEQELYSTTRAMAAADVSGRIEQGFPAYAAGFTSGPDVGEMELAHPFDSHPPLSQRLGALGVTLADDALHGRLGEAGDGGWRAHIPDADDLEREQWQAFERRFRDEHEASLPYRFLPETPEERELVERSFPPVTFDGPDGPLTLTCDQVHRDSWPTPVRFADVTNCELTDAQVLKIQYADGAKQTKSVNVKKLGDGQAFLDAFQRYYHRYLVAVAYRKQVPATERKDAE